MIIKDVTWEHKILEVGLCIVTGLQMLASTVSQKMFLTTASKKTLLTCAFHVKFLFGKLFFSKNWSQKFFWLFTILLNLLLAFSLGKEFFFVCFLSGLFSLSSGGKTFFVHLSYQAQLCSMCWANGFDCDLAAHTKQDCEGESDYPACQIGCIGNAECDDPYGGCDQR